MTFLEKATLDGITNPLKGCPYKYGYEKYNMGLCAKMGCVECWGREMPQKKSKAMVYVYGSPLSPTAIELRKMSDEWLNTPSKREEHRAILDELNEIYAAKNHDYGDSFHDSFIEDGLLMAKVRIGDKYKRFCTLVSAQSEVQDESIRDTLLDLANYAVMTIMELDRKGKDDVEG